MQTKKKEQNEDMFKTDENEAETKKISRNVQKSIRYVRANIKKKIFFEQNF